jgi:hypothetical protein
MTFRVGFILSFILHLSLVFFNFDFKSDFKEKKESKIEINVLEKEKKQTRKDVIVKSSGGLRACNDWYGGIGVLIEPLNNNSAKVTSVYSGYAAEKAGIFKGDILFFKEEIKGEIGSFLELSVVRNGFNTIKVLVRDRICLE